MRWGTLPYGCSTLACPVSQCVPVPPVHPGDPPQGLAAPRRRADRTLLWTPAGLSALRGAALHGDGGEPAGAPLLHPQGRELLPFFLLSLHWEVELGQPGPRRSGSHQKAVLIQDLASARWQPWDRRGGRSGGGRGEPP